MKVVEPGVQVLNTEWSRRVLDVAVHTTGAVQVVPWSLVESSPPLQGRCELGDELWIGKLGSELATKVMDACDPAGLWHHPPIRQYGELYSYVRERVMPLSSSLGWDEDDRLQTCIVISRLLHPTTISFQYAARVVLKFDGAVDEIIPGPVSGLGSEVWLPSTTDYPNWLVEEDIVALRELLRVYPTLKGLPRRVSRALWYFEYAARTYYLDVRWILVCTGLEALVHTDREGSTSQFKHRVSQMASEVGLSITTDESEEAYAQRSSLAHGLGLWTPSPRSAPSVDPRINTNPDVTFYRKFEDLLRIAVVRALRDSGFRDVFEDESEIRQRWLLP